MSSALVDCQFTSGHLPKKTIRNIPGNFLMKFSNDHLLNFPLPVSLSTRIACKWKKRRNPNSGNHVHCIKYCSGLVDMVKTKAQDKKHGTKIL